MSLEDVKKQLLSVIDDSTPNEETKPQNQGEAHTAMNTEGLQTSAENSQSITESREDTPKEKHSGHDKFSKLDSLRHSFDTHRKIEKTEYIGGMFARRGVTVVAGASGVGKTTFMQRFFHDLSIGGNIFGGFYYEDKPKKSIILAGELGEDGLIERAQEFDWHSDPNYVEVIDMISHAENGIFYNINEAEGQANIEHLAQTSGLDLLIFDSFGMFYSGKEKDNDALREAFSFLMGLARKYNIAVVVVHHSRKRLSNEQTKPLALDDLIGGNAIARYSHRVIAIEYNKNYGANTVTCLKSWGKFFKPFTYSKKEDIYGQYSYLNIELDPKELDINTNGGQVRKSEGSTHKASVPEYKSILFAFLKGKGSHGATIDEIMDILGRDKQKERNTTKTQLKRMIENKELIKPKGKRGIYALTETSYTSSEDLSLNFETDTGEV